MLGLKSLIQALETTKQQKSHRHLLGKLISLLEQLTRESQLENQKSLDIPSRACGILNLANPNQDNSEEEILIYIAHQQYVNPEMVDAILVKLGENLTTTVLRYQAKNNTNVILALGCSISQRKMTLKVEDRIAQTVILKTKEIANLRHKKQTTKDLAEYFNSLERN